MKKKRDDRRKKRLLLPACAAVLLGACLLLRVGGAAWKNSQLEAGFTPSPRFSDYRDGVPMEEMDVSQYQVALSVITNPVYGVYYFTCSQDISYYAAPGGEPVYTIPAGTELAWSYGDFLMDTYPTYWKGWRWGTVFPLSGEETPQGYFFVSLSALEGLVRDFYNATPSVEKERIQRGLSRKEVRDGLLRRVDEIFYRRGVCVSPDLRAPLWGWDCTLLAGGCALATGAWAAVLRRRKMRKEN